jgi:Ca2+-dependent lipid-binding protein
VYLTASSMITAYVQVNSLSVSAQLRVQLKLLAGPPFIGRVRIQTLEAANICVKIKPTVLPGTRPSINVMEVPGLSSYLQDLITVQLRNALVAPEFVEIDVGREVAFCCAMYMRFCA